MAFEETRWGRYVSNPIDAKLAFPPQRLASTGDINEDCLLNALTPGDFVEAAEPFTLFGTWFEEAKAKELNDPEAMALATADVSGLPDARMVLLKDWSEAGFVFYTNAESAKGMQLTANMQAAALFHWKSLRRQVRLRGPVTPLLDADADAYFASRPRDSRIGAWASQQSRPLESRFALEKALAHYALKFGIGDIPRPPYWRGYAIVPVSMEFWADKRFRLHDRLRFTRDAPGLGWTKQRLFP